MPAGNHPTNEPRSFYESSPRQPSYDEKSDYDSKDEKGSMRELVVANPPPPYQASNMPIPVAAPRPGYAAPIGMLNRPEPAMTIDTGRQFDSPAPSISGSMTPITPIFARPHIQNVQFDHTRKPIMRGDTEGDLLPKRGEQGDDFWRRFSMIAKEETKPSKGKKSWLEKNQSRTSTYSRKVWIIGLTLFTCIVAAIALGLYFTRNNAGHQVPTAFNAFGGAAEELSTSVVSSSTKSGKAASSTPSKVQPTLTLTADRRDFTVIPRGPAIPAHAHELHMKGLRQYRKRRSTRFTNATAER